MTAGSGCWWGAGFLLALDTLASTVAAVEVPLRILTACLGAPFFLWLMAVGRRGWTCPCWKPTPWPTA